jgi:hypothetical protein
MPVSIKERPALFKGEMVRAILRAFAPKTQTRRFIKIPDFVKADPADYDSLAECHEATTIQWLPAGGDFKEAGFRAWMTEYPEEGAIQIDCPYGKVGDRLWVRETWKYWDWTEDGMPWIKYQADDETKFFDSCIPEKWSDRVEQVWAELSVPDNYKIDQAARDHKWRPSIFLPRWASRIMLEIISVRAERLQDISVSDAIAEGYDGSNPSPVDPSIKWYAYLWEFINGPGSWDANPWVWVIEFKMVKP